VFNAFMTDLQNTVDDNTMKALGDDTVITVHGDTTILVKPIQFMM